MDYSTVVEVYERLTATTKRLEKTKILSDFLKEMRSEQEEIILLLQGRVFPPWEEKNLGVSTKLAVKAISIASGNKEEHVIDVWREKGDLGDVAKNLISKKKQMTLFTVDLDVDKVFKNLRALSEQKGSRAVEKKMQLIAELLTSASGLEAKYIIRTVLEDLRIGVSEGILRDAFLWRFFYIDLGLSFENGELAVEDREVYNDYAERIQESLDLTNDYGKVYAQLEKGGIEALAQITLEVGKPVNPMLALKAKDIEDGFARIGKPAIFEFKYDGFRIQLHKDYEHVMLFTRRLEDVTHQFPDIVKIAQDHIKEDQVILDCEAVGVDMKTGRALPFQFISQRIRRKYDIDKLAEEVPITLHVFDILLLGGRNIIKEPFITRREHLERIIQEEPGKLKLARRIVTSSKEEAMAFFDEAINSGNEGLMIKKHDAPYKPGSRVGFMMKLKSTMENLEVVVVGAEWGEGKRSNMLSSFTIACMDENYEYKEIGKVATGIKEKEEEGVSFMQLTEMLRPHIISQSGREVKVRPEIVLEVAYEEIQKSPGYGSGYALRFPRFVCLREDRSPEDCSPLSYVEELYRQQHG